MTEKWGDFEIRQELGRGGMGVVYKAWDPRLQRMTALKVLADNLAERPELRQRFIREARSVAALNHPNIVGIHLIDEMDGKPFFVMEFIDGETLAERIRRNGGLSPKEALDLLEQAAAGLNEAHKKGIIHRDIKPANIMINAQNVVKMTDFGIARVNHDQKLTATDQFMGTPGYLSPEICLGEEVTPRSDIFSLGVVFYEMLAGTAPFEAKSPYALIQQVVEAHMPPTPKIPPKIKDLLQKMVHRNPQQRFSDCNQLIEAIHALKSDEEELENPIYQAKTVIDKPKNHQQPEPQSEPDQPTPFEELTDSLTGEKQTFRPPIKPGKSPIRPSAFSWALVIVPLAILGLALFWFLNNDFGAGMTDTDHSQKTHAKTATKSSNTDATSHGETSSNGGSGNTGVGDTYQSDNHQAPVIDASENAITDNSVIDTYIDASTESPVIDGYRNPTAGESTIVDGAPGARDARVIDHIDPVQELPFDPNSFTPPAIDKTANNQTFDYKNPQIAILSKGDPLIATHLEKKLEKLLSGKQIKNAYLIKDLERLKAMDTPKIAKKIKSQHIDVFFLIEITNLEQPRGSDNFRARIALEAYVAGNGRPLDLWCGETLSYNHLNAAGTANDLMGKWQRKIRKALRAKNLESYAGHPWMERKHIMVIQQGDEEFLMPFKDQLFASLTPKFRVTPNWSQEKIEDLPQRLESLECDIALIIDLQQHHETQQTGHKGKVDIFSGMLAVNAYETATGRPVFNEDIHIRYNRANAPEQAKQNALTYATKLKRTLR